MTCISQWYKKSFLLVITHFAFNLAHFLPCPIWQAPRASSYPQRGVPGPNVYNLQRSFTDKCDFSVGASRVFRLPVGVQLDSPKHITPAPNQYDVCISKLLSLPLLPTPNADNQTCVLSVRTGLF